jgi:hypothetical protein
MNGHNHHMIFYAVVKSNLKSYPAKSVSFFNQSPSASLDLSVSSWLAPTSFSWCTPTAKITNVRLQFHFKEIPFLIKRYRRDTNKLLIVKIQNKNKFFVVGTGEGKESGKEIEWLACIRFGWAGFGLASVRAKPPLLKDASSSSNSLSRPLEETEN